MHTSGYNDTKDALKQGPVPKGAGFLLLVINAVLLESGPEGLYLLIKKKVLETKKEVWLRGEKDPGLPPELQPAADALLQAGEELDLLLADFPRTLLWERPAGVAAVGFHLKHIAGVLDRLLSYAEEKTLSPEQLAYLKNESVPDDTPVADLLKRVHAGIEQTLARFRSFSDVSLTAARSVGRAGLPATLIGLCFHAAEHTMRHTGQLLVTVKVLRYR